MEWKLYSHDQERGLGERLREAGFTAGWERAVLVAEIEDLPRPGVSSAGREVREAGAGGSRYDVHDRIRRIAAGTGPHRTSLAELEANAPQWGKLQITPADARALAGRSLWWDTMVFVLESETKVLGAAWYERVDDSEFSSLGGMTGPYPELVAALARRAGLHDRRIVAEADGALQGMLEEAGFQEITRVRTYHWYPPGSVASDRPVQRLIRDPEHDAIWNRFEDRYRFMRRNDIFDGITEPSDSVTWHLAACESPDDPLVTEIQEIVERGLRACAKPGERLYWLDWQHEGARFDPERVGGPGRPRWPGRAYPDADYHVYLTDDLRLGTFGNPREDSLCVFGDELLAEVEEDLTALLGIVLRRGGRNLGNIWEFGPPDA
ncbi:DUF2716 domain-containing protein [Actinoallomurus iriomotensis]|uniref:DUF2716 domain-containing protein n=1 Tax=Actinoallomurus iriomotensis TaxID=478107 RepID=UPI0025568492|nr:DUF2716 domain-containing protein [Actinoallomurus iriomotensis]